MEDRPEKIITFHSDRNQKETKRLIASANFQVKPGAQRHNQSFNTIPQSAANVNPPSRYMVAVSAEEPRYAFGFTIDPFSGNSKAIASLAVQHLMGEQLDTDKAVKAIRLYGSDGATPDQLVAKAKKMAEGKVGDAARLALERKDAAKAFAQVAATAELDAISAAREGVQTGLKMGMAAERAKASAERRIVADAAGASSALVAKFSETKPGSRRFLVK